MTPFSEVTRMICQHCFVAMSVKPMSASLGVDKSYFFIACASRCPECDQNTIELLLHETEIPHNKPEPKLVSRVTVYPQVTQCKPVPNEVPASLAADYREASLTLNVSPKASAALSRRCLQNLIQNHTVVGKKDDLAKEIKALVATTGLPSWLSSQIDHIRELGNFAAHPKKSTATGEIIEVELGEADAMLGLLEELFDFYFVKPKQSEARAAAIQAKVDAARK